MNFFMLHKAPRCSGVRTIMLRTVVLRTIFVLPLIIGGLGAGTAHGDESLASRGATRALASHLPEPALKVPAILSDHDVKLYRKIFAVQKKGQWRKARKLIRQIDSRLLMGHVLAQRYLHRTKYRSKFGELSRWMKLYADHPEAGKIYRLALKRKPRRAKNPRGPKRIYGIAGNKTDGFTKSGNRRRAGKRFRTQAERKLHNRVLSLVRRNSLSAAERYLLRPASVRGVARAGIDRARGIIAGGWFRWGNPKRALKLASRAVKRSGASAPQAAWWAGLAAFKLKQFKTAARYFAIGAKAPHSSSQNTARAALWAARANLVGRRPEKVNQWLERAAQHPRTFYGLIAIHILGAKPSFNWHEPAIDPAQLNAMMAIPSGRRALALLQVGHGQRAWQELRIDGPPSGPAHLRTIIALADVARLPNTAYRAAKVLRASIGEHVDAGLYPVPPWEPGTYSIDRALVFAITRQESAFNSKAKSPSGARGLMQLMPATARYMRGSRRAFRGRNLSRLFDPKINLALGQKYVDYLLTGNIVAGNIIMMTAAYNGGPGNTAKWQRNVPHGSDPLVFIETIPRKETRLFVKRVLENLWIYRMRLSQDAPTLTALAGGKWPYYVRLDGAHLGVAQENQ
jgi:soluble lytic murein transglycosylase-like protein